LGWFHMVNNWVITDDGVGFVVGGVVGRGKIVFVIGGWKWVGSGKGWKVELMLVVLLIVGASTRVVVVVVEMIRSGGGGGWFCLSLLSWWGK